MSDVLLMETLFAEVHMDVSCIGMMFGLGRADLNGRLIKILNHNVSSERTHGYETRVGVRLLHGSDMFSVHGSKVAVGSDLHQALRTVYNHAHSFLKMFPETADQNTIRKICETAQNGTLGEDFTALCKSRMMRTLMGDVVHAMLRKLMQQVTVMRDIMEHGTLVRFNKRGVPCALGFYQHPDGRNEHSTKQELWHVNARHRSFDVAGAGPLLKFVPCSTHGTPVRVDVAMVFDVDDESTEVDMQHYWSSCPEQKARNVVWSQILRQSDVLMHMKRCLEDDDSIDKIKKTLQ